MGRLWHIREIIVVHEYYVTAVTQHVMSLLYEKFPFNFEYSGPRPVFVGCTVRGEKDSVGLRIVTDLLELEGFNTYYRGSEVHEDDFLRYVKEKTPQLVVSCEIMEGQRVLKYVWISFHDCRGIRQINGH